MLRRKFLSGLAAVLPLSLLRSTGWCSTTPPALGSSSPLPNEIQEITITGQPTGGSSGWLPPRQGEFQEAPHRLVHFLRCPASNALYRLSYMEADPHSVGFKLESVDLPINRARSDGLCTYYFATCSTTGWRGEWELIAEKVYDNPKLTSLSTTLRMNLADMHERLDALLSSPALNANIADMLTEIPCNVGSFSLPSV